MHIVFGILEFGVQLPCPVYIIFTKHVVKKSKRTTWDIGDLADVKKWYQKGYILVKVIY